MKAALYGVFGREVPAALRAQLEAAGFRYALPQTGAILREFKTRDLLREILRRSKGKAARPRRYCDDCAHFRTWEGPGEDPPDKYNPCEKGHAMSFHVPDSPDPHSQEWGFYRNGCPDRK